MKYNTRMVIEMWLSFPYFGDCSLIKQKNNSHRTIDLLQLSYYLPLQVVEKPVFQRDREKKTHLTINWLGLNREIKNFNLSDKKTITLKFSGILKQTINVTIQNVSNFRFHPMHQCRIFKAPLHTWTKILIRLYINLQPCDLRRIILC